MKLKDYPQIGRKYLQMTHMVLVSKIYMQLLCSCLENPRDGGAWWAATYGVAQSRTRLKRLSGSSSSIRDVILWKLEEWIKSGYVYAHWKNYFPSLESDCNWQTDSKMQLRNISAAAAAKSLQSCPTLCNPIDGSLPGSSIPGIFQARVLEWVAIAFSMGLYF